AGAIALLDRSVREMRSLGVYDRSVIVLLSDHGEGLGDHGEEQHGIFLYRETLQVPLMVKLPGGRLGGRTIAAPAELADVAPTLAGLVGVEMPAGRPGRSLLALDTQKESEERRIYAETFYPRL